MYREARSTATIIDNDPPTSTLDSFFGGINSPATIVWPSACKKPLRARCVSHGHTADLPRASVSARKGDGCSRAVARAQIIACLRPVNQREAGGVAERNVPAGPSFWTPSRGRSSDAESAVRAGTVASRVSSVASSSGIGASSKCVGRAAAVEIVK